MLQLLFSAGRWKCSTYIPTYVCMYVCMRLNKSKSNSKNGKSSFGQIIKIWTKTKVQTKLEAFSIQGFEHKWKKNSDKKTCRRFCRACRACCRGCRRRGFRRWRCPRPHTTRTGADFMNQFRPECVVTKTLSGANSLIVSYNASAARIRSSRIM
jgi:hypothetical protein